jgi:hypothetical protein
LDRLEAELGQVNVSKQMLSFAKHHGRERQMQLVEGTDCQIVSNRGDASTDSNVLTVGGGFGLLECCRRPFGYEEKRCAAFIVNGVRA